MIFIIFTLTLLIIYILTNVISVLLDNYHAYKFFQTKSPNLPVLPKPNPIYGHLPTTIAEKNCELIDKLHKEYGTTFGYYMCNQPWVSTKDLDLIKLIELDQPNKHINRSRYGLPFKEFNHSIFQVDDDDWRRIRRIVSPAFSNHSVRSYEVSSDIECILNQLMGGLEIRLTKGEVETGERAAVIDMGNMFERYTLAVIFLVTYKQDNLINFNAEKDDWTEKMDEAARQIRNPIMYLGMMFPFARSFCDFLIRLHPVGRMRHQIVKYITQATNINRVARVEHKKLQRKLSEATGCREKPFSELKQSTNFKRRLVDSIIDAYIEKRVGYDNFVGTLLFLLLAGFETTADTITCLIWNLTKHPAIQDKLRKELLTDKGIDCEYMYWCIQETIRFHPAVPYGVGRVLGEDVTVNGTFLAKGTFVVPSTYSIHRDPKIWPDPDEFKPERWQHASEFHPAAFMGFGLGPRNCVGGKLAVHETKLVVAALLAKYRFESCSDTPEEYLFTSPGWLYTNLDKPVKIKLVAL